MRFVEGGVSEVVVTTDGPAGPNAAPMGLWESEGSYVLRVFEGDTRENLGASGEGVVNVTRDPVAFARSALGGDVELEGDPVRLASAEFHAPFEVVEERDSSVEDELGESGLTAFSVELVEGFEGEGEPVALSRGVCAALSAAVHASRVVVADERGLGDEEERVRREFEREAARVERLGGERAREAVEFARGAIR